MKKTHFENQFSVDTPATPVVKESDGTAWPAFEDGSKEAFEILYKAHIQSLIQYGYKITSDRSLIQDCIQDLFVELWQNRSSLGQVRSMKHYLLKSLRYKLIRALQKDTTQTLDEVEVPDDSDTIENQILAQENSHRYAQQLAAALLQLPKRQKEAIHLRYFQELSNEEVAQMMGVNYQSACKFIYTALRTLRKKLQLISLLLPFFPFVGKV
ncbi:RNA polymerase sigma factor [Salmonirosea aquatica]|uniref:Sigma-70 family RNA polymerase sigma factor n=1 Tax=Salmonirosea aquatica TaxID=2654236 RepID=A0A7C9F2X4_9BACT|nr:sigma-70 family RNA polymerase sigma factor [Cytophagaceae bacterium SJW1-29]